MDAGPANWADFFDTAKFPGKRSLYKPNPSHNFPIALMADGVSAADVFDTLKSDGGVERAFTKLESVTGDMIWWETGAMAPQLLADQEVVMASGWNGRFHGAVVDDNQPFHLVWDGQVYDFGYFAIAAGNPKMNLAYEFLRFAGRPIGRATRPTISLRATRVRARSHSRTRISCRIYRLIRRTWRMPSRWMRIGGQTRAKT